MYVIPINIKKLLLSFSISHVCNMWFYNLLFHVVILCIPIVFIIWLVISQVLDKLKLLYGLYGHAFSKISTHLPILLIDLLLNNLLIRNWYLVLICIFWLPADTEYFFIYSCYFSLFCILLVLSPVIYWCSSFLYWFVSSLCCV